MPDYYLTVPELKQSLGGNRTVRDEDYERAIAAATQQIDRWTGRRFLRDAVASARLFVAEDADRLLVGDFTDPTDVLVESDVLDDGTWVEWDADLWRPEADDRGNGPFVRLDGEPWRWIGVTNSSVRDFPVCDSRPRVRVTARWGWDTIPVPVAQACLELAILYFQPGNRAPELIGSASVEAAKLLLKDYAVRGGTLCCDPLDP